MCYRCRRVAMRLVLVAWYFLGRYRRQGCDESTIETVHTSIDFSFVGIVRKSVLVRYPSLEPLAVVILCCSRVECLNLGFCCALCFFLLYLGFACTREGSHSFRGFFYIFVFTILVTKLRSSPKNMYLVRIVFFFVTITIRDYFFLFV